ncbi:right-handed parallel beta-helix repeat-containing protein [Pseudomonas sp. SH1-B]
MSQALTLSSALLLTACTFSLAALGAPAGLRTLDSQWQQQEQQRTSARILQRSQLPAFDMQGPSQRGSVSLEPMYSAQAGSWPFEPFVHNGLFRAIASYQAQHPRAVVIRGGSVTLEQLRTQLNDARVLGRHEDGYLLSYPLMIAEDAALLIDDQILYLFGPSGTALINQGLLRVQNSRLQSWSDGRTAATDRPTRPFIMNWAGSRLLVDKSQLVKIGYNANLSRGISSGLSSQQSANRAPAQIQIDDSRFEEMASALDLSHSHARVRNNQFIKQQQYAIDLGNSRFLVADNRIDGVKNNSGVRISGSSSGRIQNNLILHAGKSAIEVSAQHGALLIQGNRLGASQGYGLMLRQSGDDAGLLIQDNLIANSKLSAIDAAELSSALIVGNRIHSTPEYAISLRNAQPTAGELVITGNTLESIGKAMIRVEGMQNTILGDNQFKATPLLQNLLIGDLLPLQSQILDSTVRRSCHLQISQAPDSSNANAPTCSN